MFRDPFFKNSNIIFGLDKDFLDDNLLPILKKSFFGELFIQKKETVVVVVENGKINLYELRSICGFSLRKFTNNGMIFFSSNNPTIDNLKNFIKNFEKSTEESINKTENYNFSNNFYSLLNKKNGDFLCEFALEAESYLKNNKYVINSTVRITQSDEKIEIFNETGNFLKDDRPGTYFWMSVTMEKNGRKESYSKAFGKRMSFIHIEEKYKEFCDEILEKCEKLLESKNAPSGNFPIVLSPGENGTLIHEAVGHSLEGDFYYKSTSCFSGMLGKKVGNEKVNVVDNGCLDYEIGSLNFDDEGTPTENKTLINNGIIEKLIEDKQSSFYNGTKSSGSGRRQSFQDLPIPRMTNTYITSNNPKGNYLDFIENIEKGIFCVDLAGGQVNISSGQFVFDSKLSFLIENGKITTPLKESVLMGNCLETLNKIEEIGNDFSLCGGSGMCGKNGQSVPVTVGCPSVFISSITVGGK